MRILMVCLGNICRSPMAEGIMKQKAAEKGIDIEVDSSGTSAYHTGENPDPRAIEQMEKYRIDISNLTARQFKVKDFDEFDRIYTMDDQNHADVLGLARNEEDERKVDMILNSLEPGSNSPVPDPYFGAHDGFEHVHELLDKACNNILKEVTHELQKR